MIQGFFLWLLATFVVEPVRAEWDARLRTAGASPAVVAELGRCATEAGPALAGRAAGDPWWGVATAVGVWLGTRDGVAVLAEATPGCAAAVAAARPLLAGPRS
jgi:hypothetical protein